MSGEGQTNRQRGPRAEPRLTQGIWDEGQGAGNTASHGAQAMEMAKSTARPSLCRTGPGVGGGQQGPCGKREVVKSRPKV